MSGKRYGAYKAYIKLAIKDKLNWIEPYELLTVPCELANNITKKELKDCFIEIAKKCAERAWKDRKKWRT